MILLEELTHRTTLAGLATPHHVQVEGTDGQDDLLLSCDPTTPRTGALLFSFEGYRAGEIPLAYVAETGELLRFDGHFGSLTDLSVLWPLTARECMALDAERAESVAAREGEESEPDWAPTSVVSTESEQCPRSPTLRAGDADGTDPAPVHPGPVCDRSASDSPQAGACPTSHPFPVSGGSHGY